MGPTLESFSKRREGLKHSLRTKGSGLAIITPGSHLRYLTDFQALALERITALVISSTDTYLVVPKLEYHSAVDFFSEEIEVLAWDETTDPYQLIRNRHPEVKNIYLDENMPYMHVEKFQQYFTEANFESVKILLGSMRSIKDQIEISELQSVAQSINNVHEAIMSLKFGGKTEFQLAREIAELILIDHVQVDFVIVASGENSANPHHQPHERIINQSDVVVIDIGGKSKTGYRSDCTRTYHVGDQVDKDFLKSYEALKKAQRIGVDSIKLQMTAENVDQIVRAELAENDLAKWFIHRLGHGIGLDTHEDPYLVKGNSYQLSSGNVFSIEPGFYIPGKWGARIEDIIALKNEEVYNLNDINHDLRIVN
jgi:Xaa-Pro aminopeptidase